MTQGPCDNIHGLAITVFTTLAEIRGAVDSIVVILPNALYDGVENEKDPCDPVCELIHS